MIDFSVIVPLYNCESLLESLIHMLNNQSAKNFDVIFIDDKSTDGTVLELKRLSKSINFNYTFLQNKNNLGPGLSRNKAMEKAEGKYILFLDSDDFLNTETISVLTQVVLQQNYPDAIIFDYFLVYRHNKIKCSTIPQFNEGFISVDDAIVYSTGATWCKVYKTDIIKKNNIIFPDMRAKEDFVFNKIALSYCDNIYYKHANLYEYITNPNSVMNSIKRSEERR